MKKKVVAAFFLLSLLILFFVPGIAFSAEKGSHSDNNNSHGSSSSIKDSQENTEAMMEEDEHIESSDGPKIDMHEEGTGDGHGANKTIDKNYSVLYIFLAINLMAIAIAGFIKSSRKRSVVA